MDAKATIKVGAYSRGGTNRVQVHAADHDFHSAEMVTPVGILLPQYNDLSLYGVTSKVTSDCLVDILCQWWESNRVRFSNVTTLVLNLDNGPENHSRRTQFLSRLIDFVKTSTLTVILAYYPPYHSKYNSVERCWGRLEQHWNGNLLDTVETIFHFAATMKWQGKHPHVECINGLYKTGVRLSQKAMAILETQVQRLPGLEKWFVKIRPEDLISGGI